MDSPELTLQKEISALQKQQIEMMKNIQLDTSKQFESVFSALEVAVQIIQKQDELIKVISNQLNILGGNK